MKKMTGFLFALGLAAATLLSTPATVKAAAICHPPACFASPGCCVDRQCGAWCESRGLGAPHCGGNGSGGCCWCEPSPI